MKSYVMLLACVWTLTAQAELYRWTDADGKVHFSDRKPDAAQTQGAEVTEEEIKAINIQDSKAASEAMRQVFPDESHPPVQENSERERELAERKEAHCREAREYLRKVSGRVQFIDKDGKMVHVSERERQERQAEMETYVKEHCS